MRQSQSNRRRSRGRNNKSQNPLTKNFESNGPDVKIRGTASHISEKYNSLARDALTSSDIVRYENYLQHAEHYNRIIMSAQQNQKSNDKSHEAQTSKDQASKDDAETTVIENTDPEEENQVEAGETVPQKSRRSKGTGYAGDKHANGSNGSNGPSRRPRRRRTEPKNRKTSATPPVETQESGNISDKNTEAESKPGSGADNASI